VNENEEGLMEIASNRAGHDLVMAYSPVSAA
jgi:hypothetical protein